MANIIEKDKEKVQHLIKNLSSIDTGSRFISIPPLPGIEMNTIIYNRACYSYLREFILESKEGKSFRRFCITGNPGIGKTYFGMLLLVDLLKKGHSVLIDNKDYTAFISPNNGGELFKIEKNEYILFAQHENTWCIIDGREPQVSHDFRGEKLVMVSSPNKEVIGKFTKAQKTGTFYMPTWEEREFLECEDLYEEGVTKSLVEEKFKICVGNARWIFGPNMSLDNIKSIIDSAVTKIDLKKVLESLGESFSGDEFSHKLIHIKSHLNIDEEEIEAVEEVIVGEEIIEVEGVIKAGNDIKRPYDKAICTFASEYVKNKCLTKFKKDNIHKLCSFIEDSRDLTEMAALCGHLFEMLSHAIICRGGEFQIRDLSGKGQSSNQEINALEQEYYGDIGEIRVSEGKYYWPIAKNYQSIDGYIHSNILFQMTIAGKHGVKQEGLKKFDAIDRTEKIRLYFVVPEEKFKTYQKQNYLEGTKKAKKVIGWIDKIEQYALCMKFDTIDDLML